LSNKRNTRDLALLNKDSSALLSQYQPIVEAVVTSFIAKGFFKQDEKMDVVQTINTQMLEKKLERIQSNFNGSVLLSTYFSKVVYNACLELTRIKKKKPDFQTDEVLSTHASSSVNPIYQLAIQDELHRFEGILRTFYKKKTKTRLGLKLFARIILSDFDLGEYRDPQAKEELAMVRTVFFSSYDELMDKEVYEIIIKLFNKIENKRNDADSLRKWVNMILDKIIRILNGEPPKSHYQRDTLKILMQLYFQPSR